MKIKVKYIGKIQLSSNRIRFVNGGLYTIEEELFNRFSDKFEKIETPKPEVVKPDPKPEPEVAKIKPASRPKRKTKED